MIILCDLFLSVVSLVTQLSSKTRILFFQFSEFDSNANLRSPLSWSAISRLCLSIFFIYLFPFCCLLICPFDPCGMSSSPTFIFHLSLHFTGLLWIEPFICRIALHFMKVCGLLWRTIFFIRVSHLSLDFWRSQQLAPIESWLVGHLQAFASSIVIWTTLLNRSNGVGFGFVVQFLSVLLAFIFLLRRLKLEDDFF